jgi:hypothetical protein
MILGINQGITKELKRNNQHILHGNNGFYSNCIEYKDRLIIPNFTDFIPSFRKIGMKSHG